MTSSIKNLDFDTEEIIQVLETPDELSTEISKLFTIIVKSMKLYKSYLPQGLITDDFGESSLSSNNSSKSIPSSAYSTNSSASSNEGKSSRSKSSTQSSKRIKASDILKESGKVVNNKIFEKNGSLLMIKIENWSKNLSVYSAIIELCQDEVSKSNGFIINFKNQEILASWNIKNTCVNYSLKACLTGLKLKEALEQLGVYCKMYIVTGILKFGNMGCEKIKSFNYFGDAIEKFLLIESLIGSVQKELKSETSKVQIKEEEIPREICIVVDEKTKEEVKFRMKMVLVNRVSKKFKKKNQSYKYEFIYLLKEEIVRVEKEWMYSISDVLQEKEGGDVYSITKKLEECLRNDNKEQGKYLLKQLQKILEVDSNYIEISNSFYQSII